MSAKTRGVAKTVMAGLVSAIHVFMAEPQSKMWMPGTRPGMTERIVMG